MLGVRAPYGPGSPCYTAGNPCGAADRKTGPFACGRETRLRFARRAVLVGPWASSGRGVQVSRAFRDDVSAGDITLSVRP
jgi:hypothetical protein